MESDLYNLFYYQANFDEKKQVLIMFLLNMTFMGTSLSDNSTFLFKRPLFTCSVLNLIYQSNLGFFMITLTEDLEYSLELWW